MAQYQGLTMAAGWAAYSKTIFGDFKPSTVQYTETRRAFYAGMITLQSYMNGLPDDEKVAMVVLKKLEDEKQDFISEVASEVLERLAKGRTK